MSKKLSVIFAGTPEFAARHLDALLSSDYRIIGVLTQPDRPAGRGKKLITNPVKKLAEKNNLSIFQPASLITKENQQIIKNLKADIMVVVAYGLILPQDILTMPCLGCINVHGSLLPRWRGAAPIQRAIWAGDSKTGITIIQMNDSLDAGEILWQLSCPISNEDTGTTLCNKLANIGSYGLIKTLKQIQSSSIMPEVQDESLATYAKKLNKNEAKMNWSLSAIQLERCVRAFNPWPISWILIDGQPIKIWKASVIHNESNATPGTLLRASKCGIQIATADKIINLEWLQPACKKVMSAQDFLNSRCAWLRPGRCLS